MKFFWINENINLVDTGDSNRYFFVNISKKFPIRSNIYHSQSN